MNEYRNRETKAVISEQVLRNSFPNVMFPEVLDKITLETYGFDPVLETPLPVVSPNQKLVKTGTTQDSLGNWIYTWGVIDLSQDVIVSNLNIVKKNKWYEIQSIRDKCIKGGILINEKWFHTDSESMVHYLAMLAAGDSLPDNIQWKTMDGSFITMTPALIKTIYQKTMLSTNTIFSWAESLRVSMESSPTPESFDISVGWPAVYIAS